MKWVKQSKPVFKPSAGGKLEFLPIRDCERPKNPVTAVFTPQRLPSVFSELSLHLKRRPCRTRSEPRRDANGALLHARTGVKTQTNVNSDTSDATMLMLPHFLTFTCSEAEEGNVRKRGRKLDFHGCIAVHDILHMYCRQSA